MKFAQPEFFWLLLGLPILFYLHFFRENFRTSDFRFPTVSHMKGLNKSLRTRFRHIPFLLRTVAFVFLIVVLARPQIFDKEIERSVEGIDIILCMDTSTSMAAEDLKPNRIEAAKNIAIDFVEGRTSDRIGVVLFAGQSFTQCPLTTDYGVLTNLIKSSGMRMVEDGTAIGMGLATSCNRLRESEAKSKVIVLLTDGVNNRGELDPATAAQVAKSLGIRVYTIGTGTHGTAPYPIETVFGKRYQNVPVEIDEEMLKLIADETGGKYFRATNEKSLKEIYEEIDRLETSVVQVEEYQRVAEVYGPWLLGAILCILLESILSLTGLRKLP